MLKSNNHSVLKPNVRSVLQNYSQPVRPEEDTTDILSPQMLDNLDEKVKAAWYRENTNHVELDLRSSSVRSGLSVFNIIDNQLELINNAQTPKSVEDIWNLKSLFEYANHMCSK